VVDIYLFRHAEVDYTPPAKITRHNLLTPRGHQMAERLATRCREDLRLQQLFCSTMPRAEQTAQAILQRVEVPLVHMPELEEVSILDLEGFPGELPSEDLNTWQPEHFVYANRRMWQRVTKAWKRIQEITESQQLECVGILSHGGPINALIRHFLGLGPQPRLRPWINLDYASITRLCRNGDGLDMLWINDIAHIQDLLASNR